jgi:hypothetical protein
MLVFYHCDKIPEKSNLRVSDVSVLGQLTLLLWALVKRTSSQQEHGTEEADVFISWPLGSREAETGRVQDVFF